MRQETVVTFEIRKGAFLGMGGDVLQPLPNRWAEALPSMYRWLHLTRAFDNKAIELQRTGRLGTYASSLGQEAIGVGVGVAMSAEDVLVPSFREHGAQLVCGVTLTELFLYWGGDERGSDYRVPREDFPVSVTVGGHAPHAAGVALAMKLRGERRGVVCMFGDGATSKGDVYEAMNFAGVWQLPLVFVVSNNEWAISTPRSAQTASQTLAQKAIAAGFSGEQVDGNDVVAVAHCVASALERARSGEGPHLIECLTYRVGDHTTADDASRYREDEQVEQWRQRDPITRVRRYMGDVNGWTDSHDEELVDSQCQIVLDAANEYLEIPAQRPESIFDYLFDHPDGETLVQRAQVEKSIISAESEGG